MKASLTRLGSLWKLERKQLSLWVAAIGFAALFALLWDRAAESPSSKIEPEDPLSASTFIPAGFVLVPIEVANYESLDSILGKFGVVDLFKAPLDGKGRPLKVAERVKILRAPLNPSHFAVLVEEKEAPRLVMEPGAFTVVVQNPNRDGTRFVKDLSRTSRDRTKSSRIAVEVVNGNL